jgi:hypothetical protein
MRRVLPLAACLLLAGFVHSQNVLVVAPTGAPFTQIQPAVDAAQHGDVVLVKPGTYSPFAITNKGVAVVADASGQVFVSGSAVVREVAADRDVLLHGLSLSGGTGTILSGCAGSVRIQDTTTYGALGKYGLQIEGCADLSLAGCSMIGADGFGSFYPAISGRVGCYARGSQLALFGCQAHGGHGSQTTCAGGSGGNGVSLQSAYGFLARSVAVGGNGQNAGSGGSVGTWPDGGNGGNGILVGGGPGGPSIAEYLNTQFLAGTAGTGTHACFCGCGITTCCDGDNGIPGVPILVTTGGSGSALLGVAPTLAIATNPIREQSALTLSFQGQPGDLVTLLINTETSFERRPDLRGVRLVQRAGQPLSLIVGTIGPSGILTTGWIVPELGAGVGARVLHMQSLHRKASGGYWILGNLVSAVLLDQAY